jgi:hypothetical protein
MRSVSSSVVVCHRRNLLTFQGEGVFQGSNVVASITEVAADHSIDKIGSAIFTVHSVAVPGNGDVILDIYINWDEDLPYRVTLFIDP